MSKLLRIIRKLTRARGVAVSAVGRGEGRGGERGEGRGARGRGEWLLGSSCSKMTANH